MNLDYFDQLIPKRWILLLRYLLPFFKTPSDFYFKSRDFIDKLKRRGHKFFPWHKFADLIFIFEKYAYTTSETNISRKIIDAIFTKINQPITEKLIEQLFERFNPDDTHTVILNDVLRRLPTKLYIKYFRKLNTVNCSSNHLKWCTRYKDKFPLEDKLTFILLLPNDKLIANRSEIFKLAIEECEEKFLNHKFGLTILNAYLIEHLLKFIFTRTPALIFSNNFIQCLINQLMETQDPTLASYTLKFDLHTRFNFFENFLMGSQNFQKNIHYFFSLCPDEQWPDLIDQFIMSAFNATESEMTNDDLREKKSIAENSDLLLTHLQEQKITCPLKLFQFLAIQTLTKKPLDLEALKNVFAENLNSLEYRKNFPIEFQSAVIENSILSIKMFIKDHFMIHVAKENTRHPIHRAFYKFLNNEDSDKALNILKLILKKLPQHLQASYATDLNFLQQLLLQLYLILEDPSIIKFKNESLMNSNKNQREDEEKFEARRELLQRIQEGKQSSVAYQRMEELFGDQAQIMQEKWKKNLGLHFFDANDEVERKLALKDAAEIINFNREHNDFSNLSTSPSSGNYFK